MSTALAGALTAILALICIMLLRSLLSRHRVRESVQQTAPTARPATIEPPQEAKSAEPNTASWHRDRDPNEPLGVRISEAIERIRGRS